MLNMKSPFLTDSTRKKAFKSLCTRDVDVVDTKVSVIAVLVFPNSK